MYKLLALLALLAGPAAAQTCPTRPTGDASNACASTAFVNNTFIGWGLTGLTPNLPVIGSLTGTISQGTRSGNTTAFATTSGALSNGHCVSIDSSGNLIDAGAACSTGGGGGTVSAATVGQLAAYTGTTTVSGISLGQGLANSASTLSADVFFAPIRALMGGL